MPIAYSGRDYRALPREPQPWVIESLIPVGGSVNLYGKPKTRKSWLALDMAMAISNGYTRWKGYEVRKHGPVLYIQADTPREEWAGRLDWLADFGHNTDNIYFADRITVPAYPFNVLDPKQIAQLKTTIDDIKPVLTVFDTLRESFDGDENDSRTMRNVVNSMQALVGTGALLLLSHQRKDNVMARETGQEDLMDDQRGSSYVSGRMDVIMRLTEHTFTYKGRAVELNSVKIQKLKRKCKREDDPTCPPPLIYFEDERSEKETPLIEAAVRQLQQTHVQLSVGGVVDYLLENGVTTYGRSQLNNPIVPEVFARLGIPHVKGARMRLKEAA